MTDRFAPQTVVTVILPRDPHQHDTGTVHRTYADGGDMVHVVRFPDGSTADYNVDDLRMHAETEATP